MTVQNSPHHHAMEDIAPLDTFKNSLREGALEYLSYELLVCRHEVQSATDAAPESTGKMMTVILRLPLSHHQR